MEKQKKSFCDAFELLSRFDRKQKLMEKKTEKKWEKKKKKDNFVTTWMPMDALIMVVECPSHIYGFPVQ